MSDAGIIYPLIVVAAMCIFIAYRIGRTDGWIERGKAERQRVNYDGERLDWLDMRLSPYVEGQSQSWPYGEHTANEWSLIWPAATLRDAIDAAIEQERIASEEDELRESVALRERIAA